MRWIGEYLRRLGCVLRRRDVEDGLDAEIRFHLDRQIEKNMAAGMSFGEAHRQALLRFGGGARHIREGAGDQFRFAFIEDSWRDLRQGIRALRRAPGFTALAALTLALGIGAAVSVFSVVNGVLLKPLSYPRPDTLIGVWHTAPGTNIPGEIPISATQYFTYREQSRTFQEFGLWSRGSITVTGLAGPEQVPTLRVTEGTLPALGVTPMLGRLFSHEDDSPRSPETVVLTYGYWQRRYGGDPAVVGATIRLDGTPHTIIGVMPERFRFLNHDADLILPFRFNRGELFLGEFNYQGLARLKPGVTIAEANADVARIIPLWLESWEAPKGLDKSFVRSARMTPALRPLKQDVVGDISGVLWIVMGVIGIVLLIACANVANLMLVRAEGRQQETAVRSALGAGRWRLLRQWMLESLALTSLSGALGLVLSFVILRLLVAIGPSTLPRLEEIGIDRGVLAFTAVLSVLCGLLFGSFPVLRHVGGMVVAPVLGGSSRTSTVSRERARVRHVLVVAQVALALVLLVASGLMIRSFLALGHVDPGFRDPERVQLIRVNIPETQIADEERVLRMQNDIRDAIAAIPGVSAAAFASSAPMEEFNSNDALVVEGREYRDTIPPIRRYRFVSPGFFEAAGIRIVAGRDLTWVDHYQHRPVVLVSENLACELWQDPAAALGKRVRENAAGPWREVIGVVGDVHDDGLHQKASATVYWPMLLQDFWGEPLVARRAATFVVRSNQAGTDALLRQLHQAVWRVNADLPLAQVRTLATLYERSLARTSFTVVMLAIAGGIALVLGSVGIYGVIAYTVSQRQREIGIRTALGAQRGELRRMFVGHAVTLAIAGVVCGVAAAAGLTRFMTSLLFGVGPLDAATYGAVALLLIGVAAVASYIPACRATAIDPVSALRAE